MKGKSLIAFGFGCLLLGACNSQTTNEQTSNKDTSITEDIEKTEIKAPTKPVELTPQFAIGNMKSDELLLYPIENSEEKIQNPDKYVYAIYGNKYHKIQYLGIQEGNKEQDQKRDTPYNFKNLKGYHYKVVNGPLDKEAIFRAIIIVDEEFANKNKILQSSVVSIIPDDLKKKVEKHYGRTITNVADYKKLGENGEYTLFAVQFANKGNDALAVVGLIDKDGKMFVKDYPAQYDAVSTWHVDDEGKFSFDFDEAIEIDGNINLLMYDYGGEGVSQYNMLVVGDSLVKGNLDTYLYQAPL